MRYFAIRYFDFLYSESFLFCRRGHWPYFDKLPYSDNQIPQRMRVNHLHEDRSAVTVLKSKPGGKVSNQEEEEEEGEEET